MRKFFFYRPVNTDKPNFVSFLVFVGAAAPFIAKILSFENVVKREAILNPVPKQWISSESREPTRTLIWWILNKIRLLESYMWKKTKQNKTKKPANWSKLFLLLFLLIFLLLILFFFHLILVYALLVLLLDQDYNYSRCTCCHPTRSSHFVQVSEFRNSMKNEVKTTCVWKLFQTWV